LLFLVKYAIIPSGLSECKRQNVPVRQFFGFLTAVAGDVLASKKVAPSSTQQRQRYMNNKLYIGGIPYASTDADLANHFAAAGNVASARVITDRETGRSRGFGFVEMTTPEEAQKAIDMFDGKDFQGRMLRVSLAKPMEPRGPRMGGFDR